MQYRWECRPPTIHRQLLLQPQLQLPLHLTRQVEVEDDGKLRIQSVLQVAIHTLIIVTSHMAWDTQNIIKTTNNILTTLLPSIIILLLMDMRIEGACGIQATIPTILYLEDDPITPQTAVATVHTLDTIIMIRIVAVEVGHQRYHMGTRHRWARLATTILTHVTVVIPVVHLQTGTDMNILTTLLVAVLGILPPTIDPTTVDINHTEAHHRHIIRKILPIINILPSPAHRLLTALRNILMFMLRKTLHKLGMQVV